MNIGAMIRIIHMLWLCPLLAWGAPATLNFSGPLIQGGLVQGRTVPGSQVEVEGRRVRLSDEGIFLVGLGRDAPAETQVRVRLPDGRIEEKQLSVAKRQYDIQRIDNLPPSKVTPNPEQLERIERENRLIRAARQIDSPRTDFLTGFIWPAQGRISGVYGSQRILNGEPRQPHYGVDIAAPVGARVVAPADGVVSFVHEDMFYTGATLVLDHGHGLSSSFLHLHRILVREGQRVRRGDPIAEVGASGRVTGAHLDWRINLFDERLDPQLLVGPMPKAEALKSRAPGLEVGG